jgi:hypothetical protein
MEEPRVNPAVGEMLVSPVDTTTVVVIRWPDGDIALTCGGVPMVKQGQESADPGVLDPAQSAGTMLGKRYAAEDSGVELLCTKAGRGTLAIDGVPIPQKTAKPLPASD